MYIVVNHDIINNIIIIYVPMNPLKKVWFSGLHVFKSAQGIKEINPIIQLIIKDNTKNPNQRLRFFLVI